MAFPTTAAPSLAAWQLSYNGLTLGPGTPYAVYQIDGLDLPVIRNGDTPRTREHGEIAGLDLMGGRDLTLQGDYQTDGTSLQHAGSALATAFAPGVAEAPLWIAIPNLPTLAAMVRPRKRQVPLDQAASVAMAKWTLGLHGTDPRLYAPSQSQTVGLGTPAGGLHFPVTFPATFGGGTVAGIITANNAGNVDTRPVLTITGPCTNPVVTNATTGWSLTISNPTQTGYTVLAGDTLVIDLDLHTVLYYTGGTGAGAPRRAWVVAGSVWPSVTGGIAGLAPGNNTIQFTSADSSAVAGTLTAQWASAYLI